MTIVTTSLSPARTSLHPPATTSTTFKTPHRSSSSTLKRHKRAKTRCTPSPQVDLYQRYSNSRNGGALVGSCHHGDRFIPTRRHINFDLTHHALMSHETRQEVETQERQRSSPLTRPLQKEYRRYMKSAICGVPLQNLNQDGQLNTILAYGSRHDDHQIPPDSPYCHDMMSPSCDQRQIDPSTRIRERKIPAAPFKSLQLPGLIDDFYINVLSWSHDGILSIGLDDSVYLFNFHTCETLMLTQLEGSTNFVTSLSWGTSPGQYKYLAIGTNANTIELWDAEACRCVRVMHAADGCCVTTLAWNRQWLSSSGSDSVILQHDLRKPDSVATEYFGHNGVVCGLAWNADGSKLASGSHDDTVCIWDASISARRRHEGPPVDVTPQYVLTGHASSIKALAWCPFRENVLASGGGSEDKSIKLWNTQSGSLLNSVSTGAQVTSLVWSKHYPELLSSHGFSGNQLILWKFPTMSKIQTFHAHKKRVLHMAISPDGRTVASAGVDEILHFWNMFGGGTKSTKESKPPMLRDDLILPGTPAVR